MNLRRYIDRAVKREVRRYFWDSDSSILRDINRVLQLCKEESSATAPAAPTGIDNSIYWQIELPLTMVKKIIENPGKNNPIANETNKLSYAKRAAKEARKIGSHLMSAITQTILSRIQQSYKHVTSGSEFKTSGDRPYRTVAQQMIGMNVYNPKQTGPVTAAERKQAEEIYKRTNGAVPMEDIIKQILSNRIR